MEKSREGKRSGNGGFRRRSRSGSLRESSEAALEETARLRSREVRGDRDGERSGHVRRRRGDRKMSESNRDEREDTTEESEEEEEDDDEERASVRMPPPPVSIPRKTRSAYAKRSHENWISGSGNNGATAELLNRHSSASTSPSREVKASAPTSPSSSSASIRKKMKPRPTKNPKSPSSIQEIEIEVAEVLFGLTRQFQEPSNTRGNNDLNDSAKTAKSTQNSTQSSSVAAPKRKRAKPLKIEAEQSQKSDEEKMQSDNPLQKTEKDSISTPARDGGETSINLTSNSVPEKTFPTEDDKKEPKPSSNGKIDSTVQDLRSEVKAEQKEENVGTQKVEAPKTVSKLDRAIPNPSTSTSIPMPLEGRSASLNTVRPKHCSTHCYIAKSIQYQQQLARMGTLYGPLYGSKPTNSNSAFPSTGSKITPTSNSLKDVPASHKKQPSQQHAEALPFPPIQQHPPGTAKPENPNLGPSSLESSDPNPSSVSFNYPNLPNSETQYLLLQNPGYPFQLPAYRGGPHPFFNGSVYLHPSQLQPIQKNPSPSSNLTSPGESSQQNKKVAAFPASLSAAMSGPLERKPGISRPEIEPNLESSSRTLNLIPCSSMNGPRAPPLNQRQLQFHQQQRHLQLQQQQQQLQLQQQLAASQKGKTSSASDGSTTRLPKYPASLTQHWKTSSTSTPVVIGRAPPQLSFGGRPPAQQTSQAPRLPPPGQLFFSNPYYQRPPPDQHAAVPPSSGGGSIRGLPPPSLLQAAQFAATSGAHTLMSAAGFPYLHAMPSVPVRPAEHKPATGK